MACDTKAVKPISVRHCWWRLFEAIFQLKLKLEPQERWFSNRRVLYTVRNSTGKVTDNQQEDCSCNPIRVKFQEPSSSSRVADAYGNLRQLQWSATDRHLLFINTPAYGSGWWRTVRWSTSQHLADGRSYPKKENDEATHRLLACKARIYWQ